MSDPKENVVRAVADRQIGFIQLWFTDILGFPKAVTITPAELEMALAEGMSFDGSAIDGFSRIQEADMLTRPDAATFQVLPWTEDGHGVARMFCDITHPDGTTFEGDPRHVLRRTLAQAKDRGFTCKVAPEIEYFYFAEGTGKTPPTPLDHNAYFDLDVASEPASLRLKTMLALETMGIPVEYAQHEDSPSQHEIDLRYTDALPMADAIMTTRVVTKHFARANGIYATFMPKPLDKVQGSGMHTHLSLFEGDENAFADPNDPLGLSLVAKGFIAGLVRHAREISLVTNQWINSFKRLGNFEAPKYCAWGRNNRSVAVNVPHARRNESARIEYRAPDPAANPYLALTVMIAAGLRGVEEGYELPREATSNLYEFSPQELAAVQVDTLPSSLHVAIDELEQSEFVASVLGEHVFEWLIRNKREEWHSYETRVSQYELERHLPRL